MNNPKYFDSLSEILDNDTRLSNKDDFAPNNYPGYEVDVFMDVDRIVELSRKVINNGYKIVNIFHKDNKLSIGLNDISTNENLIGLVLKMEYDTDFTTRTIKIAKEKTGKISEIMEVKRVDNKIKIIVIDDKQETIMKETIKIS